MSVRVYQIYIPEVGNYVKFKVLSPEMAEEFVNSAEELSREDYMKRVLENVVYNMKTEIIPALREMSRDSGKNTLEALFNGCVMLNPGLDIDSWVRVAFQGVKSKETETAEAENEEEEDEEVSYSIKKVSVAKKITKARFLNLDKYLKERVIGQDQAIEAIVSALKRSQAGLNDEQRPLGVFLFAGSSGVGKTHLARELHAYLFGDKYDMIRVDCGELQHKHENQKLLGAPPGYIGHDDGGVLTNQIEANPDTVVLLDEVEKAHPDIWNTFLRIFDEGLVTNNKGEQVSFRNAIIIMTTNLGNSKVVDSLVGKGVGFGGRSTVANETDIMPPREQVVRVSNEAIKQSFKPEFLNRIDKIVVFNHLTKANFADIAELELMVIDDKLGRKGTSLKWDDKTVEGLISRGVDTIKGARGMAQVRREMIEDPLAEILLSERFPRGTIFELTYANDKFDILARKPTKVVKAKSK